MDFTFGVSSPGSGTSASPTFATSVTSPAHISGAASPATVGVLRLGNAEGIYIRNAADNANYVMLYTSSTNEICVGATASTITAGTTNAAINAYNNTLTLKSATSYCDVTQMNIRHQTGTSIVTIDPNGFLCNSAGSAGFVMASGCVFAWNAVSTAGYTGKPFTFTGQVASGTGACVGGLISLTGGVAANGSGVGGAVNITGGAGVTGGAVAIGPGVGSGGTNGVLNLINLVTTTTAPSAGGGSALPATPAGYVTISIGGTPRQIAYY